MAELERARVRSHMSREPFRFIISFPVAKNTVIRGTQQAVKTPIAIASVQATRTSLLEVTLTESVRAPS